MGAVPVGVKSHCRNRLARILCTVALLSFAIAENSPVTARTAAPPAPQTVRGWLEQKHLVFRRYLAIVTQATHDYSYGYKTPMLLMPVAIDLFTGYVVHLHQEEARLIYPVARQHMTPVQQQRLQLIEMDQDAESGTVRSWQREVEQYEHGQKQLAEVGETIDYLARMINRHLVLQEEHLFPSLDLLTPQEQAAILKQVEAYERDVFGSDGQGRYEALLAYLEGQIKEVAGRVW